MYNTWIFAVGAIGVLFGIVATAACIYAMYEAVHAVRNRRKLLAFDMILLAAVSLIIVFECFSAAWLVWG